MQLNNLPDDVTQEMIEALCQHSHLIKHIHIISNDHPGKVYAWLDIDCGRVALNAICNIFNNRYMNGHHIMAYPTLYSN